MTHANAGAVRFSVAVLMLGMTACSGSPESTPEGISASIAQALGGHAEVVNVGSNTPLDIGPTYSVFLAKQPGGTCDTVDVIETKTGVHLTVPAPSGCPVISAGSSQSIVLIADKQAHKIYRLTTSSGGGGGSGGSPGGAAGSPPPPSYVWAVAGTTTSATVSAIVTDASEYVWWFSDGLYRAHVFTGTNSPAIDSFGLGDLLAIDTAASRLWANVKSSNPTSYALTGFELDGTGKIIVATSPTSFAPGFSFDADHLYWVENSSSPGGTNRLRSATKVMNGSVTTIKSSTTVEYFSPVSNGSMLFWFVRDVSAGTSTLRRKNLSNANELGTSYPFDAKSITQSYVMTGGVYSTPSIASPAPAHWSLIRSDP